MKQTIFWAAVFGLSFSSQALTLNEALERARQTSPELRAALISSQAAEKGMNAAGLWKNPTIPPSGNPIHRLRIRIASICAVS